MVGTAKQFIAELIKDNDPLVYQQEYLAEFVDWAGVAFFGREKLLENGQPVPSPTSCDCVFAVIDTASKTGTDHDATAVTFFALDKLSRCQQHRNHRQNQMGLSGFRVSVLKPF